MKKGEKEEEEVKSSLTTLMIIDVNDKTKKSGVKRNLVINVVNDGDDNDEACLMMMSRAQTETTKERG